MSIMDLLDRAMKFDKELGTFVYLAPLLKQAENVVWGKIKNIIKPRNNDPRTLKVIPVKHIRASEAVQKLQSLMDLDGGSTSGRRRAPTTKRGGSSQISQLIPSEPDVSVLPDDVQNVIMVRAMQDKIEEIEMLLHAPELDALESISSVRAYAEQGATTPNIVDVLVYALCPEKEDRYAVLAEASLERRADWITERLRAWVHDRREV